MAKTIITRVDSNSNGTRYRTSMKSTLKINLAGADAGPITTNEQHTREKRRQIQLRALTLLKMAARPHNLSRACIDFSVFHSH